MDEVAETVSGVGLISSRAYLFSASFLSFVSVRRSTSVWRDLSSAGRASWGRLEAIELNCAVSGAGGAVNRKLAVERTAGA